MDVRGGQGYRLGISASPSTCLREAEAKMELRRPRHAVGQAYPHQTDRPPHVPVLRVKC
jgi:hypothetical protein